jgi:hypothetical protein
LASVFLLTVWVCHVWAAGPESLSQIERFESKVRPVLAAKCWSCHAGEKSKGGLRLDTAANVREGGDSGPAVLPGKPKESSLIQAIRYDGDLKMPPKGKLSAAEIAALTDWVARGAQWPETSTPLANVLSKAASTPTSGGRSFWAFQPVHEPVLPAVKEIGWVKSPIDRFILAGLEAKGLRPAPAASRRELIRRASFDLIGLPPTIQQIEAFEKDTAPDAFARVIDGLLASPRYGERWGRHWLDLARFAESNGMDENVGYSHAYRYRDYVISAFNADLPYDEFLTEQLAGDLLPRVSDELVNGARLTATGLLVIGPKMLAEDDPIKMEMDIIDEQVDTVGRVFMGLTIGCARCHDHKFDPIPTVDYYGLAGIFKSTKSMQNHRVVAMWNERPLGTKAENEALAAHRAKVKAKEAEVKSLAAAAKKAKEKELQTAANLKLELQKRRDELAALQKATPAVSEVMSVDERAVEDLNVRIRGNHMALGKQVPRHFPTVLPVSGVKAPGPKQSGRLELAQWLTHPGHPLTARVMANRIWQGHFGEGIVRSPDNFGTLGDRPDNPELLDWLARRFVENQWSIKAMHRLIMLSSTYQMSTKYSEQANQVDPDNRLLWRMPRKRLEAEPMRDALLAVSGELDLTVGGSLLSTKNHEYVNNTGAGGALPYESPRRAVYLPVIRSGLYDVFQAFDFADPSASNGKRVPTTVAPQALFMLNDKVMLRSSQALAKRLLARASDDTSARIEGAYLDVLGRRPTPAEVARSAEYISRFDQELERLGTDPKVRPLKTWQTFAQALLSSSEFLYID